MPRKKKKNSKKKILIASNIAKEVIRQKYGNILEFARANKIPQATIYRVMRQENYGIDLLLKIADALEIDVDELLKV